MEEDEEVTNSIGHSLRLFVKAIKKALEKHVPDILKDKAIAKDIQKLQKENRKLVNKVELSQKNLELKQKNLELKQNLEKLKKDLEKLKQQETKKKVIPKEKQQKGKQQDEKIINFDEKLQEKALKEPTVRRDNITREWIYSIGGKEYRSLNEEKKLAVEGMCKNLGINEKQANNLWNEGMKLAETFKQEKNNDNIFLANDFKGNLSDLKAFNKKEHISFKEIAALVEDTDKSKIVTNFLDLRAAGLIKTDTVDLTNSKISLTEKGKEVLKNLNFTQNKEETSTLKKQVSELKKENNQVMNQKTKVSGRDR